MTPPIETTGPLVLYVDDERPNRVVFEKSFASKFRIRTACERAERSRSNEPRAVIVRGVSELRMSPANIAW